MAVTLDTIMQAWLTAVAKITAANGYHSTVTSTSLHGTGVREAASLVHVDVADISGETSSISLGSDLGGAEAANEKQTVKVEVDLSVDGGMTATRSLMADVRKCIRTELCPSYFVRPLDWEIKKEHDQHLITGALMRFEVEFNTDLFGE